MKKILVCVDVQNDFTSGVLGNKECDAVVPKICDLIRNEDYSNVILTRDTHDEGYLESQEGKNLPVKHCMRGTEGWQIRQEIMDLLLGKAHIIVDKSTFGSLDLIEYLRFNYGYCQSEIEIDIVGVCTGICVINNAMLIKAGLPEVKINVIADACACVTLESHKIALDAMKMCQINIKED